MAGIPYACSKQLIAALRVIYHMEPSTTEQFGRLLWEDDDRWINSPKREGGKRVKRGRYRLGWSAGKVMSDLVKKRKAVRYNKEDRIYELTPLGHKILAKFGKES